MGKDVWKKAKTQDFKIYWRGGKVKLNAIKEAVRKTVAPFEDHEGKLYYSQEVVFCDIDTPGPQFMGYVTKKSFKKTNCIDDWVRVHLRKGVNRESFPTVIHDGGTVIEGVKIYKKT